MNRGPAQAEWTTVDDTDSAVVYVNRDTVRETKDSSYRKVWIVQDLKTPANGVKSLKLLQEIDCPNERARVLVTGLYPMRTGVGAPIARHRGRLDWEPLPRTSSADAVFRFVCSLPSVQKEE